MFAGFTGLWNDKNPQYLISAFCEALDDGKTFKNPHTPMFKKFYSLKIRDFLGENGFYEVFIETRFLRKELKTEYPSENFWGSHTNPFTYLDKGEASVIKAITVKINGKDIPFPFEAYNDVSGVGLPGDAPWMEKRKDVFVLHIQGGRSGLSGNIDNGSFLAEYYFDADKYIGRKMKETN